MSKSCRLPMTGASGSPTSRSSSPSWLVRSRVGARGSGERRAGQQSPVQLVDPVGEDHQFVSALNRFGRVAVIAHRAAVVLDFDLEAIAPLP